MTERDILVATVALVLGVMMVHSALLNQGWCFQMAFARKISKHRGQESARFAIGSVGTFVIFLGMYTLCAPYVASKYAREVPINEQLPDTSGTTLVSK